MRSHQESRPCPIGAQPSSSCRSPLLRSSSSSRWRPASAGGPSGSPITSGWRDAQTPDLTAREVWAVQHRIAACMAALGLPYREFVEPPPDIPDADLPPRDWAAKWGFGVSTSVGIVDATPPAADPNLAYIDSLAPVQREAYRAALFGSSTEPGCNRQANELVYGRHDRILAPLAPDLARLEDEIAHDARIVDADARWLACITTASFRPSSRRRFGQEAIELLTRRLEAVMGLRRPANPTSTGRRSSPCRPSRSSSPFVDSTATKGFER